MAKQRLTPETINQSRLDQLLHIEAIFHCFLNETTDFIYFKDKDFKYMYGSRRFVELTRHQHWQDLIGKDDFEIFDEQHAKQYRQADEKVINGQKLASEENTYENLDGELKWLNTSKARITDEQNHVIGMFGISRDITEIKMLQDKLNELACNDSLTGLNNRQSFLDCGSKLLNNSAHAALFFFDIDNFKYINDTLGHSNGDKLICAVADRLTSVFRASDVIARLGGDEFVVLAEVKSTQDVRVISKKLQNVLSEPAKLGAACITISCSIGVALYPEHGKCLSELIKHADQAMYTAKEKGKATAMLFCSNNNFTNLINDEVVTSQSQATNITDT